MDRSHYVRRTIQLIVFAAISFVQMNAFATSEQNGAAFVFKKVSTSIVTVISGLGGNQLLGSGVCIKNGLEKPKPTYTGKLEKSPNSSWIVTNAHVISSPSQTLIKQGAEQFPAKVEFIDKDFDIAILHVEGKVIRPVNIYVKEPEVGNAVFAIGSPLGLEGTITNGIISAYRKKDLVPFVQTTAAISHGNSGGGLFDTEGNLIGITTFKLSEGENLNFAIDAQFVMNIFDALTPTEVIKNDFNRRVINQKQRITNEEYMKFVGWFALQRDEDGQPISKSYWDKTIDWMQKNNYQKIDAYNASLLKQFSLSVSHQSESSSDVQNSNVESNGADNQINLVCRITDPMGKTKTLSFTVDLQKSIVNGNPALIKDSIIIISDQMTIDRYSGVLNVYLPNSVIQGQCERTKGRMF